MYNIIEHFNSNMRLNNVEAIMAIDETNGLAKDGKIPWKNKTDLFFFKNKTSTHVVVMGSVTLLSLPMSQPLPNRMNIVITNNKKKYCELYRYYKNIQFMLIEEVVQFMKENDAMQFFIIGGNQIYTALYHYCSVFWVSKIKQNYSCDMQLNIDIIDTIATAPNKQIIYNDPELEIMMATFSNLLTAK